jgi:hypothetical protein
VSLSPLHIATRGRLDGEYGIATRGYIICPDIVARWPSIAELEVSDEESFWAVVEDADFLHAAMSEHPGRTLLAGLEDVFGLQVVLDGDRLELVAQMGDLDLEAVVEELDSDVLGSVMEQELSGELDSDGVVGEVDAEGVSATVIEENEVVGIVGEDEPPHC